MQQKLGFQLKSITLCLYIKKAREQIEPFSCLMQMNKSKKMQYVTASCINLDILEIVEVVKIYTTSLNIIFKYQLA